MVGRYYFQILPWVVYFAVVAVRRRPSSWCCGATAPAAGRRASRVLPLLYLVVVHAVVLPGDIADARDFNRGGRQQVGPTSPAVDPDLRRRRDVHPPDDVIAYFRARTMTLYTDRLAIQTTNIDRVRERADFFAQQRGSTYYQPALTVEEAEDLGFDDGVVEQRVDPLARASPGVRMTVDNVRERGGRRRAGHRRPRRQRRAPRVQRARAPARGDRPHPPGADRRRRTPSRSSSSTTAPTTAPRPSCRRSRGSA